MVALAGYESPYFPNEKIIKLYEHYEARKEVYHLLDYDDLLVKTRELLYKDPAFLSKWQKRFSYLLLDEVQDMNARNLSHPSFSTAGQQPFCCRG